MRCSAPWAAARVPATPGPDRTLAAPGELQLGEAALRLATDAGVVTIGPGATLPANFPKAVPVYPGVRVNLASRRSVAQGKARRIALARDRR